MLLCSCVKKVIERRNKSYVIVRLMCFFVVNVVLILIILQLMYSFKYQFVSMLVFQLGDILLIWELKKYVFLQQ